MVHAVVGLGAMVLVAATGLLGPAADVGRVAVAFEGPPECSDRASLQREIAATLGGTEVDRPFAAAISATQIDGGYRLSIAIEDDGVSSQRVLEGDDCPALVSAAALIVAMTIDPRVQPPPPAERPGGPDPTPDPIETPPPDAGVIPAPQVEPAAAAEAAVVEGGPKGASDQPTDDEAGARAQGEDERAASRPDTPAASRPGDRDRPPRSARRLQLTGRVGIGLALGALPAAPSALVVTAIGLRGARFRAEALAHYWSPRDAPSDANGAVGISAQLWAVGARGCGILTPAPSLEIPLCGSVRVGRMHARGTGDLLSRRAASPWAAVGAGPELVWWVRPRLGLGASLEGHVTLARTEFETEPSGVAHRAAPGGGTFAIVLEGRAP